MAHRFSFQSIWNWLVRHSRDLLQFGAGFAAFETFNWMYNYLFMPFTLLKWGPVWGALISTALALAINALVYWLYDHMKIDWLKAHAMRQLADKENKTTFEKLVTFHRQPRTTWWARLKGEAQFILLLTYVDPVIVALYYREEYFQGVSWRDWWLLIRATLVACVAWLLILEGFYFLYQLVLWTWHLLF